MAFCINCGIYIADGVKFCPDCGASQTGTTHNNQQAGRRRTVYDGEIHKCPSCGEVLNSFVARCPSCGYEVRDARASNYVSEFSLRLSQTISNEEKSNLIRNFPIPNNKEDIYELLILASTNIGGLLALNVSEAWVVKVDQCYQKATLLFGNDDELTKIKHIYTECHRKFKRAKRMNRAQENRANRSQENRTNRGQENRASRVHEKSSHRNPFQIIGRNLMVIIGIIFLVASVNVDKSGGNPSGLELIGGVILIVASAILFRRQSYLSDFAIAFLGGAATIWISSMLKNGSFVILCSVIIFLIVTIAYIRHLCRKPLDNNQSNSILPTSRQNANNQTSTTTPTSTVSVSATPTSAVPTSTAPTHPTPTIPTSTVPTPMATAPGITAPMPTVSVSATPTSAVPTSTALTPPTPTIPTSTVPMPVATAPNTSASTVATPNVSNTTLNINVPQSPVVLSGLQPPVPEQPVCSVIIPRSVKDGSETNCAAVEALFVQAGFTNVKTVPLNDLYLGIMTTPGEIENITVDGKDLDSYFRRKFDSDVPVLITYHSRRI